MIRPLSLVFLLLLALPLLADDYYLIQMNVPGQSIDGCSSFFWDGDTIFYNLGSNDQTVTLAGVSNGELWPGALASFVVAPGRATSLRQSVDVSWEPRGAPPMWIVHVTAPSSLLIESSMLLSLSSGGGTRNCPLPYFIQRYGKTQLPVFRSLVAANQRQVITGLTIGDLPGHINVAIDNAGADPASATIEVHRACDGAVTETRNVTIAANTVQQFTRFAIPDGSTACTPLDPTAATKWLAYVIVTVDQPSLTFASILAPALVTDNQTASTIQVMPGVAQ